LVRFGADYHCLRNLGESPVDDLWSTMFFLHRKDDGVEELASLYKSLKGAILGLTTAGDFAALSAALELFLRQFLDTDLWEAEGVKILQRIRTSLKELQFLETRLEGFKTSSPLAFLIQDLSSGIYVPRGSEGPAIAVYPYRVSAGIRPSRHFLVGLSQKGVGVQFPLFPFLREDQRSLLELEDRDLTEPYLETYLRSGDSVFATCARETPQGAQLAPGFLVARGDVENVEGAGDSCPYRAEQEYWAGTRDQPVQVLPRFQKNGFAHAYQFLQSQRRVNLIREPLVKQDGLKERLCDSAGLARASSYRMDSWKRCPAEFLFRYGWKVEEPQLEASWEDYRQMGNLRHNVAEDIFKSFGAEPFPESPSAISEGAMETAAEVFDRWEQYEPLGKTPFWAVVRRGVEAEVETLLRQEASQFAGYAVRGLEVRKEIPRNDLGVAFNGQIDRVVRRGGSLGIIDYKSSFRWSERSLISPEGEPHSYQMPIYILFLAEEDGSVEWAVYYNFRKGKFIKFLKPGQEEVRDRLITVLEEDAREYADDIRAGRFMPPPDCEGCDYRILCRQKYFIKGDR